MGSLAMIIRGTRLVVPAPTFDAYKGLQAVEQEETNIWYGTPTMYVDLLDNPRRAEFKLPKLNYKGLMAGSICPEQLLLDLRDVFNCRVFVAYGTTENSPITFMSTGDDSFENQTTTVGYIMPHTEAKVIDTDQRVVNRGESGELCIRGACIFAGYWNQPDKTREAIGEDGWYKTGDLAVITEEGYAKIVGRAKDMIIRYGQLPSRYREYI